MSQTSNLCTLVSTMAGGPQVVTFALDELLRRGEEIKDVLVVHLAPQADPLTAQAIKKLTTEFAQYPCRLQFFPIRRGQTKLDDIRNEEEADVAWSAIYALLADLKARQHRLHVCISGGRRILALQAMSAAMLHFDHNDRLWHMYTPPAFLERAGNGAIMHACPKDGMRLIQVPMMPWGAYFPTLRTLAQPTPHQVIAIQGETMDAGERVRCQKVLDALTARQADVLRTFATGQSPQDVAESLGISLKTVDTHKTVIFAECRVAWNLPEDRWLGYRFFKERFGRFFE